jgi:hypothetical protein
MKNVNKVLKLLVLGFAVIMAIVFSMTACNDGGDDDPPPAHTHQWGAWTVTKAATCIAKGAEKRTCALDGSHTETQEIAIAPNAHDWDEWGVENAPTCTETGIGSRVCKLSAEHTEDGVIPALEHDYANWTTTTDPTCTTAGEETGTCTHDNSHTTPRAIPALEHDYANWTEETAPTCTTPGEETGTCTHDVTHTTTRAIPALEHDYANWTQTTAPTCTTVGVETRTCSHDATHKETRSVAIDTTAHDYQWVAITPATYTTEGVETEICTHDATHTRGTHTSPRTPFTTVNEFSNWLKDQPDNTAATAYTVALNLSNFGGGASSYPSIGGTLYRVNGNKKYVYLDFSGSTMDSIPENAFYDKFDYKSCTSLIGITIPSSVNSIGNDAFYGCSGLTSVTIGNINNISWLFSINSLTEIHITADNSLYTSEDGILYNKNKTTLIKYPRGKTDVSFIIPNSVTSIGIGAFNDCTSLTSVTIPNSVTSIGNSAFSDCSSLTSVTIPDSVTTIGNSAFSGCSRLTSVTIPDSVTTIDGLFSGCSGLTSVTIPNSVTSIESQAFWRCTSLTSVTIPDSVTSIGRLVFAFCDSLTSVTFEGIISSNNFNVEAFGNSLNGYIGGLRSIYLSGGIGTYTRPNTGLNGTWTKQP